MNKTSLSPSRSPSAPPGQACASASRWQGPRTPVPTPHPAYFFCQNSVHTAHDIVSRSQARSFVRCRPNTRTSVISMYNSSTLPAARERAVHCEVTSTSCLTCTQSCFRRTLRVCGYSATLQTRDPSTAALYS